MLKSHDELFALSYSVFDFKTVMSRDLYAVSKSGIEVLNIEYFEMKKRKQLTSMIDF